MKQFRKSQFVKDIKEKYNNLKNYFGFGINTAAIPGCGTGTIPGSECHKKLIFKNITIDPKSTKECEVLAGRAGAFKARKMQIICRWTDSLDCFGSVEICKIYATDIPQTMNFSDEKGLSDVFNKPVDVDFSLFGAEKGEGLKIEFYNPNAQKMNVYVTIWGDAATSNLLGKA